MLASILLRVGIVKADEPLPVDPRGGRAEELFNQGRALMLEGKFDEACPLLSESNQLERRVGTLLNLAACHERQGKVGSAWTEYNRALITAAAEGQSERVILARDRIAVVEPRVSWITVKAGSLAKSARITLDENDVPREAWGTEMPVDPGPHVLALNGALLERLDLKEAEHRSVSVVAPATAVETSLVRDSVEPQRAKESDASASGFVFELGGSVGFLEGEEGIATGLDLTNVTKEVRSSDGSTQVRNCTRELCPTRSYRPAGTWALGLTGFAGVATSADLRLGVRALGAHQVVPHDGHAAGSGRSLVALGPGVMWRVLGPIWLDGAIVAGATWYPEVYPDQAYSVRNYDPRTGTSWTGITFGASGALAFEIAKLPRDRVVLSFGATGMTSPTGAGSGVYAPVALSYRSR